MISGGTGKEPAGESSHGDSRHDDSPKHRHGPEKACNSNKLQLERVPGGRVLQMGELLGHGPLLESRLGFDLEKFQLNEFMVNGNATKFCKNIARFLFAIVVNQPPWRVGHEDHADEENDSRRELQADRNEP